MAYTAEDLLNIIKSVQFPDPNRAKGEKKPGVSPDRLRLNVPEIASEELAQLLTMLRAKGDILILAKKKGVPERNGPNMRYHLRA